MNNSNKNKKDKKPILWEELTWKDIEKLVSSMKMVIIPVGACEQHGPHLPLCVDTVDCYEIAKRVSAKTRVPVIPPLMYGCSQSHGKFPGTLSIRPETMIRMICDIIEWLYNSGIRKVLLLNGHMWNWGPIYSARENIHYDFPDMQVRVLDWWSTTSTISSLSLKDCPTLPSYVHANIGETSCMLAIRPDLVKMEEAGDQDDYKTFFEYRMDQYSTSGIVGRETTKSTKEFGQQILNMVIDNLALMIKDALKEEIPNSKGSNNMKN
jgi:creatinine amidohydrolase